MTTLVEGTRVRLTKSIERWPFGVVDPPATGTVVSTSDDRVVAVLLDEHVDWLDSWGNCLLFDSVLDDRDLGSLAHSLPGCSYGESREGRRRND